MATKNNFKVPMKLSFLSFDRYVFQINEVKSDEIENGQISKGDELILKNLQTRRKVSYASVVAYDHPILCKTESNSKSFKAFRHRLTRCKAFKDDKSDDEMKTSTKLKVRTDRSAVVLVSIVILFLITHCYRLALKVYEVASPNAQTMETFKVCFALKR